MKILFIGGSGNISSAVSQLALKMGFDLYHLNRGARESISGVKTLIGDINNEKEVAQILETHTWDVVVDWIAFDSQDIDRDFSLFKQKTRQFIFISTASAYQKPSEGFIITEKTPLVNPFWDYSQKKINCEIRAFEYYHEHHFPVTIVRPSHTYNTVIPIPFGGWTEYTVAQRIINGEPVIVPGDGNTLWTLTHASDFAIGLIGLFGKTESIGEAYQITSDKVYTWNHIYNLLGNALGVEPKLLHISSEMIAGFAEANNYNSVRGTLLGDKAHCAVFDNTKIKSLVPTFNDHIGFDQGIKTTLQWFNSDVNRKIINPSTNEFINQLTERWLNFQK